MTYDADCDTMNLNIWSILTEYNGGNDMKKKRCLVAALCFLLFIFTFGCGMETETVQETVVDPDTGEETIISSERPVPKDFKTDNKPDSMTLLIYMVGSDLEAATAAATNDMTEMQESGVNLNKVNILVYTGGSPKWHNDSVEIPTDSNAVFELTKKGFQKVNDFEVMSMGEPDSLSRFLKYGYENYKADSYGLILWDHGNGPVMGYGSDIQYGKDALTLPEIETALSASPFAKEKLAFIGFDACLMASVELACVVDDYADYMIASQEVEPGFGWNYAFLKNCCKTDTGSLMQSIVENYISYSEDYFAQNEFFKSEVTLSIVDLTKAKELETALDTLFVEAADDVSGSFTQLVTERVETRAFGRATTGSEYDLVDMQALMDSMKSSYAKEAESVQKILDEMVVYSDSNTSQSSGLSLYYPYYNKKYYEASWKDSYAALNLLPNYIKYLDRYGQIWLGTDMQEYFSGKLEAQSGEEAGTYTLQLTEEQASVYADSGFYILRQMGEDIYSLVYYSQDVTNENGLLTANFDGRIIYYGDDLGFKGIPVTRVLDEVDGVTRYAVFPTLTGAVNEFMSSDSLLCRMVLNVDAESGVVTVSDFSESGTDDIQTGKRPQVNLDDWVRIQFFEIRARYLTRDADGGILQYWQWPEGDWILANEMAIADGLNFTYEKLYDDGNKYFLMFDIMDAQGNQYSSELYPITLEEAPEMKEPEPTDAGTMEGSSIQIFDRDGVQLYLDLIEDETIGQTAYCYRAENQNDYSVRMYIQEFTMNDKIRYTDSMVYLATAPGKTSYEILPYISETAMLENMDILDELEFHVSMWNEENDKTLVNNEEFLVKFSKESTSKMRILPYKGALAKEQSLGQTADGVDVTLKGAGFLMSRNDVNPDAEFSEFTGIIKYENTSEAELTVRFEGMSINGVPLEEMNYSYFGKYQNEITLKPGQTYYYRWLVDSEYFEENAVQEITSVQNTINGETFTIVLEE